MKVEKIGNSYRVRKMVNGTKYTLMFDHEPLQKEIKKALTDKMAETPPDLTAKGSFEYYAVRFLEVHDSADSPSTIRSYHAMLKKLSDDFKRKQLKDITQEDVTAEINRLGKTRKPKTVRNYHGLISGVIKFYRPNFALHTKLPQKVKAVKNVPIKDDVKKVLDAVAGTRYEIPYRLAVYGLRRSEICALEPTDLSQANKLTINKAKVQNKDKKWVVKPYGKTAESNREITIDQELADLIRQNGVIYDGCPSRLYDNLKIVQKRLGIEPFRLHDFRGYLVTELSDKGISDADIMAWGGWSTDYVMKEHYRQSRLKQQQERAEQIINLLT